VVDGVSINQPDSLLASDIPAFPVVTDDSAYIVGDPGRCVRPQNPEALAQAILQLFSATTRRCRAMPCPRQILFSPPSVHQYEDLYREHLFTGSLRDSPGTTILLYDKKEGSFLGRH
jgi:hypothetical protein